MNISVVTTPVHNTLGINTVSASTEAEALRIAQIDLASFITDIQLLTVALYCSHPTIWFKYSSLPCDDYRSISAKNANDLHHGHRVMSQFASDGFFNRQLQLLLDIGRYNSDYGRKLVPVFAFAIEHKDELLLEVPLVDDIQRFLAMRDFVDGYTMISQTVDTCCIMPSLWIRKEVE